MFRDSAAAAKRSTSLPLGWRVPINARKITVIIKMHLESAVIGALHRFPDTAGEINVGRSNNDCIFRIIDGNDSVQRVLGVFCGLLIAD